jgi:branched-chain amino acid aminotransferase
MSQFLIYNGTLMKEDECRIHPDNRSFRYGDGLFETMKVVDQKILLKQYHFERIESGMKILKLRLPSEADRNGLEEMILQLCSKNETGKAARVRLNVFRKSSNEFEESAEFMIQCWPIDPLNLKLNEKGWSIGVYPVARKSCDQFANIKSNNYLPYSMAALHAKEHNLDDCLVLNSFDRICDSSIANIFWVKNNQLFTTPLAEGCVSGVMRRHIIENVSSLGYTLHQTPLTAEVLHRAEEVFLTNAIVGIRWVAKFEDKSYGNTFASNLYSSLISTI